MDGELQKNEEPSACFFCGSPFFVYLIFIIAEMGIIMENFSLERNGANVVLHISEDLDHHAAAQISKTIDVLIEKGNVKNVIFDFSGLTFMDSSGIGMVMGRSFVPL